MGSTITSSNNQLSTSKSLINDNTSAPSSDTGSGGHQAVGASQSTDTVGGGETGIDAEDATITSIGSRDPEGIHESDEQKTAPVVDEEKETTINIPLLSKTAVGKFGIVGMFGSVHAILQQSKRGRQKRIVIPHPTVEDVNRRGIHQALNRVLKLITALHPTNPVHNHLTLLSLTHLLHSFLKCEGGTILVLPIHIGVSNQLLRSVIQWTHIVLSGDLTVSMTAPTGGRMAHTTGHTDVPHLSTPPRFVQPMHGMKTCHCKALL